MRTTLPHAFPRDSREDLGYGRLSRSPRFDPRKENISFPYEDPFNEYEYSEEEDELADAIANKTVVPRNKSDMIPVHDQSSYGDIIKISEIAKGISPFPDMYKNREGHLGSSGRSIASSHSIGFSSRSRPTGHLYRHQPSEEEDEEHIYTLEDVAISQLREYIKLMILEIL